MHIGNKSMTGKEILSVSALVLMLSLFMVLAYQTDYAVNPDKKQYNQGEEIYIFISGPGNAGFTIKIFDPEGDLVFEESGETTGSGNGYLSCPGFSGTGKYDLILFFDGDDVADSSFIVEELEDEEDYCIDCKPATTSTTTSSTTSVISLTTTTATTTVSGSTVYVSTSTSTQGLGTTPTTSLELGTTIPSGNLQLTARRDHFSLIEKPEFDLQFLPKPEPGVEKSLGIKEFTGGESVEALVYDSLNELTNLEPEIEELGGDRFRIRLGGKKSFKPGLYRLKAEFVRDGETYTQELWFKWGLVSVNTKKSLYHPGETAVILMVVLNKEGYPVSNADVTLVVTDPGNNTETFPNELIQEISEGVYQANYLTGGEGNYTLSVTATAADVSTSIESYFMVREYYEFDLLREIPSVIDPQMGPFRSSIYVVSYTNTTSFSLEEYLPKEFELIDDGGASVTVSDDARILSWANLTNNSHVSYLAQAPAIWPYLYEIGPAGIEYNSRVFREARAWYLAVDPTTTNAPSSCDGGWSDCANAYIDDSNYATRTSEGNGVWYGYGFSIPSRAVINTVKVKIKSYVGDDTKHSISLEVYNGSSWGALYNVTPTVTPCTEEVINVTGDFSWTASMVNSIQVRATANIGTGNPSNKWAKICYLPVEVVYNTPPDVKEPETYNTSLVEKKTFEVGDNVTIQVNVTDAEGVSDLDSILITLIDPQGTVRVSNESMTNISAITNGHTYEYNYTSMPAGSTSWGVWSINIHANDTSDSWGSNTTSFNVTEYIVDVTNLEHENNHTYGLDEYESGDTVAWINVTVNNTGNSTVNNVNVSLNVLNSSGVVGWFETQTRGCGTLSVGDGCVVSFSSDTIPNTTNSGLYQWNITLNWSGG
ncbi:MAG: FixH family protein, partial [Candidatus Altiarchaeota archaeon]|nr:FixH family protein [Candidatus Altiarchaeota archaeon]